MDFSNLGIFEFLQITAVIWLLALSVFVYKATNHYKKLTRDSSNLNLPQILEKIISKQDQITQKLTEIAGDLASQKNEAKNYFKKHSLIRFNPFEEAGGDQSFVVSLLNGKNNGFVVSSLHSRTGTRIYAKEILDGKSSGHQLSKEEKESLEKAAKL